MEEFLIPKEYPLKSGLLKIAQTGKPISDLPVTRILSWQTSMKRIKLKSKAC
jgi:hypothetical protein